MMALTTDQIIILALAAIVVALLGYLVGNRGRRHDAKAGQVPLALPPGAEALEPAFGELRRQLGDLRGQVEQVRLASAAAEARHGQEEQAWQAIQRVEQDLAQIREVQAAERQRWATEDDAFKALQRLTAVMLGSATSGAAGERVAQERLEALPPQWRVTNHTVNGKTVEFAVRLPDGLFLPIDSKVVAQAELDALDREPDPKRREQLEREVQRKVLEKAAEVRKYVDERSAGFAIAAVSDALYRLSGPVLPEAYQRHRALIVPYSLLIPFVLMVYEQHRHGGDLDAARLGRLLADAQAHLESAAQVLNGHLSGALIQLGNARDKLSRELTAAAGGLDQLRSATTDAEPSK
jgi:DNA recombination protein RmuC